MSAKQHGGARRGAGRLLLNPHLDPDTARMIKILVLARGWPYTPENAARLIADWAERAWRKYDEEIQAAADEAYEGGIL